METTLTHTRNNKEITEAIADVVKQGLLRHGLACRGGGEGRGEGDCRDKRVSITIEGEGENQGRATRVKGVDGWGSSVHPRPHLPGCVWLRCC